MFSNIFKKPKLIFVKDLGIHTTSTAFMATSWKWLAFHKVKQYKMWLASEWITTWVHGIPDERYVLLFGIVSGNDAHLSVEDLW